MTYKGVDTYIVGIGTVRECIDCSCLVPGGPTRCIRCAKEGPPSKDGQSSVKQSSTWEVEIASCDVFNSPSFRELNADYFQVYSDGKIIFYNGEQEYGPRVQVAVYAPGQWYGVRKKEGD